MPDDLGAALTEVRSLLLDADHLIRAVAAGHRRGATPSIARAELRPVDLKSGRHLQLLASAGERPTTQNLPFGPAAESLVDDLLAEPFGNWHVETANGTVQLRVTKKGEAAVHRSGAVAPVSLSHDRPPSHLIDPGDPLFSVVGGTAAKRRQVDAFLRALESTVDRPVSTVVDLGCGNAYLTFAAYRYLSERWPDVSVVGVDVRADQRERNTALADGFATVGIGVGYRTPRWELRVDGRNLADRRDPVSESEIGDAQYYLMPSRRVDVSFIVRF